MASRNSEFGAGRGPLRPTIDVLGRLTHPDTGEVLPASTSADEWRGLEGYTGDSKPQELPAATEQTVAPKKSTRKKAQTTPVSDEESSEEKLAQSIREFATSKRQAAVLATKRGLSAKKVLEPNASETPVSPKTGKKVRVPREKTDLEKAQELIKGRISAEKIRVFGSTEDEYEPQVTGKSTTVLDSLGKIHGALMDYHNNIGKLVNNEVDFHTQEAQRHGVNTDAGRAHLSHIKNILTAYEHNLRGIKELNKTVLVPNRGEKPSSQPTAAKSMVETTVTRPNLSKNPLTETSALMAGAKKELAASATAIANTTIQKAQKSLASALNGIRKSGLGKLGILPQGVSHHDIQDAFSSAQSLTTPGVDYSKTEPDFHPRMGWSKPGHIWVGTMGGLRPTIRQMPVHPDSLAELQSTPINGKLPTRTHPDIQKMKRAIEAAEESSHASVKRTEVGLPVVSGVAEEGQKPVPATRGKKEKIEEDESTKNEIPKWERLPGIVEKPKELVEKEKKENQDKKIIHENMLKMRISLGRIGLHPKTGEVINLRPGEPATDRIIESLGQSRAREIYDEVKGE